MKHDMDSSAPTPDKTNLLVGMAVDVSGSMEKSIQNNTGGQLSRIESFQEALKKLTKEAQDTIRENRARDISSSIDLFAYSFGLKSIEVGDLFSLVKAEPSTSQTPEDWHKAYQVLRKEAKTYRLEDWCKRAKNDKFFSRPKEMLALAKQIESRPQKGRELAGLLKTQPGIGRGLVRFMSGFGGVGSEAVDVVAALAFGDVERAKELARELILEELKADIGAQAQIDTTLSIEEFAEMIKADGISLDRYKDVIYGNTPMRSAMNTIRERFERELLNRPRDTASILLILSDGEPTDGDPSDFVESIKSMGVTVISCFVTNQDVALPRTLFDIPEPHWNAGAKLMFNLSSPLSEGTHEFFMEKRWKITPESKLFVQLNHSELLEEFVCFVLSPLKAV